MRYSEKYTPPTKEVESENWNGKEYKEDWISMTMPRDGFKVIYDKDFTMFMAPEKDNSEFVITRMHRFNREKMNKNGKNFLRKRIDKGLTDIKLLEESETVENGYRWYYVIVGTDKNGVQRVSMNVVFEDSARKKLFQISVHGKFGNMPIVASDFNYIVENFKTEPRKVKKDLQLQD